MTTPTGPPRFRPLKLFVNGVLLHVVGGGQGPASLLVLGVPLLALNGQYGHPGVREQFSGLLATVEGATMADAGHLIAEEQPEAVVAGILAFGRRHGARLGTTPQ